MRSEYKYDDKKLTKILKEYFIIFKIKKIFDEAEKFFGEINSANILFILISCFPKIMTYH